MLKSGTLLLIVNFSPMDEALATKGPETEPSPHSELAQLQAKLVRHEKTISQQDHKINSLSKRIDERTLTLSRVLASLRGNVDSIAPLEVMLLQIRKRILNDVTNSLGEPDTGDKKREYNLLVIATTEYIVYLQDGATGLTQLMADVLQKEPELLSENPQICADLSHGLATASDGFHQTVDTAYRWVSTRIEELKASVLYLSETDTVPDNASLSLFTGQDKLRQLLEPDYSDYKNVLTDNAFAIEGQLV